MSETIQPLPAFFIAPPPAPAGRKENPAVNLVKCSGIKKSGAKIRKAAYPLIYFMGCGIAWTFATRKERDTCYDKLLSNKWPELKALPGTPRKPKASS